MSVYMIGNLRYLAAMLTRRLFIGSLGLLGALAGSTVAYVGLSRVNAPREPFLIDTGDVEFTYVDGIVTRVHRVR